MPEAALSDDEQSVLAQIGSGDLEIPADLLRPPSAAAGAAPPAGVAPADIYPSPQNGVRANYAKAHPEIFGGDPRQPGWQDANLTTVKSPSGVGFQVNKVAANDFQGFLNDLEATGYKPNADDSSGYNLRDIRGGHDLSEHAYGNAIDVNSNDNPMTHGDVKTNLPANISEIAAGHNMIWGGNWQGRKDPMHFEWAGPGGGQWQVAAGAPGAPPGSQQEGLMHLAAAAGPAPQATPTALSDDEKSQLEAVGNGQAIVGLPAGMTPEQALARPSPSMVTSDSETLGIPKGSVPLLDPAQVQRDAEIFGTFARRPIPAQMEQLRNLQEGKMLYQLPDGTSQWLPQPGGLLDPKRAEYNELLQAHARASGELTEVYVNTPYGQAELKVPKDQVLDLQRKYPFLQQPPGAGFPAGATTAPTGVPAPGTAAPTAPTGGASGAGGAVLPGAGGTPPPAGAAAGVVAPGGVPGMAPAIPGMPVVQHPAEGPAVITPPPAGPGLPPGLTGTRYLPPGGETSINGQIVSDQKSVNDLQAAARDAQRLQANTQAVLGLLGGVTTGKLGPLAGQVSGWLRALGMSDEAAQALTGTTAPNHDILIKTLLQQAAAQMAGSGQGVGLFNEFLSNLPSLETSKDAIKMFENTVNMQAQRALDNSKQGVAYFNKSASDYRNQRTLDYHPLTDFQAAFNEQNPEINYYRAAQIMSPVFAKEGHQGAADTGATDQVLRLIPRGATFSDAAGIPMQRNAKGDIVPVQPAARAPQPAAAPQPPPPGPLPGTPGGAQAAPMPGGPLAAPGLPGSSAPPVVPGLSPATIQSLRDSGMTDADIARIQGAPSSVERSGASPSGMPYATAPLPPPPGIPEGSRVLPGRRQKATGKPVYMAPDGSYHVSP